MSAAGAPREPWAAGIEAELELVAQARRNADGSYTHPTMFRVPSFIKKLKPQAYEHELLSFGLFDRNFEETTRMDEVRLQVVSEYLEQMKAMSDSRVHSWEDLCIWAAGPVESVHQLRHLYHDGPGESVITSKSVRSVLTLDAVFLTVYLVVHSGYSEVKLPNFGYFFRYFWQKDYNLYFDAMYIDLWLFENQIPLSLVRNVWNQLYEDASDHRFDTQIKVCIARALKTYLHQGAELSDCRISFTQCHHLLHCLYIAFCHENAPASELQAVHAAGLTSASGTDARERTSMSAVIDRQSRLSSARLTFLATLRTLLQCFHRLVGRIIRFFWWQRQNPTNDSRDQIYRSLLPVTELHKAGIIVRGEQGSVSDIRLIKSTFSKATIYLPQIKIDDNTEKILRNLSSFELIHSDNEHKLISYLSVMDDLINTEEDVRLLRKGKVPVIGVNNLGDDKDIATLFNALPRNVCFRQSEECWKLTKDVNEWCMQKKRQKFIRFVDRFHDRPWLIFSLLAATLLLVMTALQTTYTITG